MAVNAGANKAETTYVLGSQPWATSLTIATDRWQHSHPALRMPDLAANDCFGGMTRRRFPWNGGTIAGPVTEIRTVAVPAARPFNGTYKEHI